MSRTRVYFLGEEFIIPSELREYIGYMSYSIKLDDELMPLLFNQMRAGTYSSQADVDFVYFEKPLLSIGNRIIAKLDEDNIFDVTLRELVYDNSGYIMLRNICKETHKGVCDILRNAILTYEEGCINAYNEAASSVTGFRYFCLD